MIITTDYVDIPVDGQMMRMLVAAPKADGRYPGILLYSDIFQLTGPMIRATMRLAGYGFVVAAPEIYHRIEPLGSAIAFDDAGRERGLADAAQTAVAEFDADGRTVLDWLSQQPRVAAGQLGAGGFCIGGHLAFRAAMNPEVVAAACFYATDIHKHSLGEGMNDDSLARAGDIKGELLHIWGRQDPHIPLEGRNLIKARLEEVGARFTWHEFNAAHAFMRDEGPRHDPALARLCWELVLELFHRRLGTGDLG